MYLDKEVKLISDDLKESYNDVSDEMNEAALPNLLCDNRIYCFWATLSIAK